MCYLIPNCLQANYLQCWYPALLRNVTLQMVTALLEFLGIHNHTSGVCYIRVIQ